MPQSNSFSFHLYFARSDGSRWKPFMELDGNAIERNAAVDPYTIVKDRKIS
ncbi:MAG: hypothetical protein J6O40_04800 [Ruminococcus sp.]|nr:hypothetical protein [Ruminococcus sp.]